VRLCVVSRLLSNPGRFIAAESCVPGMESSLRLFESRIKLIQLAMS
jgi:hypothetical protein